jgi:NSS family neurotransmitter:Na+ symporter
LSEFKIYKGTIYENIDHLTSNILLPIGGFFIVVFAGWVMCRNSTAEELGGVGPAYSVWRFLARYVAPVAIVVVFLQTSGLL